MMQLRKTSIVPVATLLCACGAYASPNPSAPMPFPPAAAVAAADKTEETIDLAVTGMT